jgi:hypothetical protein
MTELEKQFVILGLKEGEEEFHEIKTIDDRILNYLDSNYIYIIVDPADKEIWIWNGKFSNVRMKFIATQQAPLIRDQYGIDFKISTIDEGEENQEFKDFIGIE